MWRIKHCRKNFILCKSSERITNFYISIIYQKVFRVATKPGRPGKHGSYGVLKKWLEILKSPLFQTLDIYFRIFRCCQNTKGRREGKKKRKLKKKTCIKQNARIKRKETENSIGKAKRIWRRQLSACKTTPTRLTFSVRRPKKFYLKFFFNFRVS